VHKPSRLVLGLFTALFLSAGCSGSDGLAPPGYLPPWATSFSGLMVTHAIASAPDGRVLFGGEIYGPVDFGGGLVPGSKDGSAFLAYFGPYGDALLSGTTGSSSGVSGVAIGPRGDFYAGGGFNGTVDFGSGELNGTYGGYFAAFARDGAGEWSFPISASQAARVDSVAAAPSGDTFLCVSGDGTTDVGGGAPGSPLQKQTILAAYDPAGHERWELRFGANLQWNRIAADPTGNLFVASFSTQGTTELAGQTIELAAYVGKVSSDGKPRWARVSTGSKTDVPYLTAIAADAEGNVVVGGTHRAAFSIGGAALPAPASSQNAFLLKMTGDGAVVFAKSFPAGNDTSIDALAVSAEGEIVLAAGTQFGVDFGQGRFGDAPGRGTVLARFSRDGALLRQQAFHDGGGGEAQVTAMALDPFGQLVVAGNFTTSLQVGTVVLSSPTVQNGWVARLAF
jgi:hypothetical protein